MNKIIGRAESNFRDAFERLKLGKPVRLSSDAKVTQNNVAREAGCDPSALKKQRFPVLVSEIQRFVSESMAGVEESFRLSISTRRKKNRSLRQRLSETKLQRDNALSLLVESDSKILELTAEIDHLKSLLSGGSVSSFTQERTKKLK